MKPCERVDSLLSAYLEEETSIAETRFLEGHFTACPRCREQRDELARTLRLIAKLPPVRTSDGFTERVLARTRGLSPAGLEEPIVIALPERRRAAWAVPMAAAAAIALGIFGVLRLVPGDDPGLVAQEPEGRFEAVDRDLPATAGDTPVIEVDRLADRVPGLTAEQTEDASLGQARDAYVIEDYEIRRPAGGDVPVLTRVRADHTAPVTVTF